MARELFFFLSRNATFKKAFSVLFKTTEAQNSTCSSLSGEDVSFKSTERGGEGPKTRGTVSVFLSLATTRKTIVFFFARRRRRRISKSLLFSFRGFSSPLKTSQREKDTRAGRDRSCRK